MTELTRLRAQIEAFAPYNEQEEADRRQMLADMDCFSDLLTRENATAHFTASCWIVNPDRTKVLEQLAGLPDEGDERAERFLTAILKGMEDGA